MPRGGNIDYRTGKSMACRWADYWSYIAEMSSRGSTVEAELMDYNQSIRVAFTQREVPDYLASTTPPYVRQAHFHIMGLPVEQRETLVVWHLGEQKDRLTAFGAESREPKVMVPIYKFLGRRHRGAAERKKKD